MRVPRFRLRVPALRVQRVAGWSVICEWAGVRVRGARKERGWVMVDNRGEWWTRWVEGQGCGGWVVTKGWEGGQGNERRGGLESTGREGLEILEKVARHNAGRARRGGGERRR